MSHSPQPPDASGQSPAPDTEGVVQFAYSLSDRLATPPASDLLAWRALLMRLELLGQDPQRYGGLSFGNLSQRLPAGARGEFVISASQSTQLEATDPAAWTTVDDVSLERFWVDARGSQPPSSETMTHAAVYAAEPKARWVFHGHSPDIWHHHEALNLPAVPASVPYGSVAMVHAVAELLQTHLSRPLVFVTLGHEDGVFSLGANARDAGGLLVSFLARALSLMAGER